jgi:hypothetical protein
VPVEVLAGPVVAHGGAWVGVPGGDLHVAQVNAGVEHEGAHIWWREGLERLRIEVMDDQMSAWPTGTYASSPKFQGEMQILVCELPQADRALRRRRLHDEQ